MSVLELRAYDATNTTFLGVLQNAGSVKYSDVLNDVGAGSFTLPVGDAKAAYVACGNVVRLRLDTTDVGAFVIDDVVQDDLLTPGLLACSGRGLLSLYERAIVYPSDTADWTTIEKPYLAKTFAYILIDLAAAATTRGVSLPTDDFSATNDSDGVAFTDSNTIQYRAGTTLMEVILQHAGLGIEVTMSPASVLHYYKAGGAGQDRSTTVRFREGMNVTKAGRKTSHRNLANAVLGMGQYIMSAQTDATSIAAYGRREKLAQHGNVSDATMLATLTQASRDGWKDPEVQLDLIVTDDTLTPFVSYGLGDTVKVILATDGLSTSYRIRAISLGMEEGGHVSCTVTLNTLMQEWLLQMNTALRRKLMSPITAVVSENSDPNIGGWLLSTTQLSAASGAAILHSTGYLQLGTGNDIIKASAVDATYRLWIGNATAASAPFRVDKNGALTSTSGTIGGWTINSTYLAKDTGTAATSSGMAPADYPFYAGRTYANRATAPFRVTPAGALVASSATITGSVTATSGEIGGWTIGATDLVAGSAGNTVGLDSGGTNPAIYAGSATPASAPFRVTKAGAVTATSGAIGGWTLGATSLVAGSAGNTVGLDSGGTNPAIYAGSATPASAPFRVTKAGALTATSGTVGGWTLGASTLTGGDAQLSNTGVLTLGTTTDVVVLSAADATYRLWIGDSTAATAPFRVTKAGYVTATSGAIGGFTLTSTSFYSGNFKLDASNKRLYVDTGHYISYGSSVIQFTGNCYMVNDLDLDGGLVMSGGSGNLLMGNGSYASLYSISHGAGNLGFFGTASTTKKTVTGSRGGNAALASLLTQLAAYGLITDSSS